MKKNFKNLFNNKKGMAIEALVSAVVENAELLLILLVVLGLVIYFGLIK